MSGVTVGSELDRLVVLRARIDQRIQELTRADLHNGGHIKPVPTAEVALMNLLGVTSRDVKQWAVEAGLLTGVRRGRVSLAIVQAYQKEHERT